MNNNSPVLWKWWKRPIDFENDELVSYMMDPEISPKEGEGERLAFFYEWLLSAFINNNTKDDDGQKCNGILMYKFGVKNKPCTVDYLSKKSKRPPDIVKKTLDILKEGDVLVPAQIGGVEFLHFNHAMLDRVRGAGESQTPAAVAKRRERALKASNSKGNDMDRTTCPTSVIESLDNMTDCHRVRDRGEEESEQSEREKSKGKEYKEENQKKEWEERAEEKRERVSGKSEGKWGEWGNPPTQQTDYVWDKCYQTTEALGITDRDTINALHDFMERRATDIHPLPIDVETMSDLIARVPTNGNWDGLKAALDRANYSNWITTLVK